LRLALPIFCAIALLLPFAGSAGSQSEIVLRGAYSGTHLRLWDRGSTLEVRGHLARGGQVGCRVSGRHVATCPLGNVGGIVVETGPSDDKVEVLSSLPVPLTAYLGSGSDKLIGNGERDTCYPQGTRRNRCIGGAGNDRCVSGPLNTDCVGGAGNDYCRTSRGSDGCWGGPGRDTCLMGRGEDGCHGEGGRDRLYGGPAPDQLYGGRGYDRCDGGAGRGRSHGCEAGPRQ
jgi:RTX calcium-binding nonapeptide repeat (4 copies)